MMGIKDWVLTQLVSKSLSVVRPLSGNDSFLDDEPVNAELGGQVHTANLNLVPSADASRSSNSNEEHHNHSPSHLVPLEDPPAFDYSTNEKKLDPLAKIERLQITFLRLLRRIGQSTDNLLVAKVLYRIHVAALIRAGEADLKKGNISSDRAKAVAAEQEALGRPELEFSFRILVLGKTGVGKSSTINSLFDQTKATTDAFQPTTDHVEEIVGTANGIKISVIDTPGLLPFSTNAARKNRKILLSVKRFIKKSPPDMVLYFERLDLINAGYSDFPLLKLITEVFGTGIWFNTILVMTHSSSALPEGPNGYPVSYEPYVTRCTDLVQHYIHQAVSDSKLENPVLLVENHPHCRRDINGDKVLPNGQVWKAQFFLLCLCTKVLSDLNTLFEFQDSIGLGPLTNNRLPSLPHLLSSFLRHHISNPTGANNEIEEISLSDLEEEDEYDQLPPIRILKRTQFDKLTDSQKKAYLDELDYRETIYLKKQLKEEVSTRREKKLWESENSAGDENSNNQGEPPDAMLLPDMSVPSTFDSDCPVHRYRCLVTSNQWLARPVLDPHGWDHDVGFDGINLETSTEVRKNVHAMVSGQMSKDKQDFSIQSECAAAFIDPRGSTYSLGLDVQSSGKELIYTLHSTTKLTNLRCNIPECGVSVTSFGNKYFVGAKVEDGISIGKRLKFVINAGQIGGGPGQVARGGSFEAIFKGRDYPVRNDKVSLTMTVLSFNKENVLGGNIHSDFRVSRGTKMSINASLNTRKMGQVCLKTSSYEHMEIALIAVVSIFRGLLRRKSTDDLNRQPLEMG
ncbi:hypothetical protein LguiA_011203 [Lonicera macranthoides]